jgi:hypothetical protein
MTPTAAFLISLTLGGSPAWAADPTMAELLDATDDIQRGDRSHAVIEMEVKTARYQRTLRMESWAEGTENTLIRILAPEKDAGVSTLKVADNIWNYLPKVDRTMKVPAGMMGGSWMGSHFSNDDLVKESRMSEDFTGQITARPGQAGSKNWVIELVPKPDAPVVWGKVVAEVTPERIPVAIRYFDEKGTLARTMSFSDVTTIDGRQVPATMTLLPADKPDELTRIHYVSLDFAADIPAGTFTLQALKR